MEYKFLYSPYIIVWHYRHGNMKSFVKRVFNYGYFVALIFRKHKTIVRWYSIIAMLFTSFLLIGFIGAVIFPPFLSVFSLCCIIYSTLLAISAFSVLIKYKAKRFVLTPLILFFSTLFLWIRFSWRNFFFRKNRN